MREKLLDLMKNEGLKPSQLAELLEINPAGISHILAGRNKPGFDLLQKILRRFPRINPDWLLLDSDKMYRDEYVSRQRTRTIRTGRCGRIVDLRRIVRSDPEYAVQPAASGAGFDNVRKSGAAGNDSIFRHTNRRRCPADRNIVR